MFLFHSSCQVLGREEYLLGEHPMGDYRCVRDRLTSYLSNVGGSNPQGDAGIMLVLQKKSEFLKSVSLCRGGSKEEGEGGLQECGCCDRTSFGSSVAAWETCTAPRWLLFFALGCY